MGKPEVSFSDSTIIVGERTWKVDFPIKQAFSLDDKIIVLYDPDSCAEKKFGQFPNLIAFSFQGKELWKAELPTHQSGDRYYFVKLENGLFASSVYSFICLIDETDGKIKSKIFYK